MSVQSSSHRINLGCGSLWKSDWRNVDGGPLTCLLPLRKLRMLNFLLPETVMTYPPDLVRADFRRMPMPFPNNSASVIFSGYCLEYLTRSESTRLLHDCFRILAPGGLIRLCQTDAQTIAEAYLSNRPDGPSTEAADNVASFLSHAAPNHTRLGIRLFRRGGVQQLFDKPSLEYVLSQVGFEQMTSCEPGKGDCPDLEWIERPQQPWAHLLYVEARKPE